MAVARYTVQWTAGSGGPGTSTFHWSPGAGVDAQAKVNAVRAFFDAIKATLPTDVSVSFPAEVVNVNVGTGELESVDAVTAPASVVGTGTQAYSAPSGARVRWVTNGIVRGRRVTGTTFIVPITNDNYAVDGTVSGTFINTLSNAANTMRTAIGDMYVWSRPTIAQPAGGSIHPVTGASVPDRAAVLRSRRD